MDGRRIRSGRRGVRHKLHRQQQRKLTLTDRYYTDDEEHDSCTTRRYSCTTFPLFSNLSDEEVMQSHNRNFLANAGLKISHSAPSARFLLHEDLNTLDIFPFSGLPLDCKIKVFTYLNATEKGLAMRVCKEWYNIMLTPSLWTNINLWDFSLTCVPSARGSSHNLTDCYNCYRKRVHGFSVFLIQITPVVKRMDFKFDIGHHRDGYLTMLQNLMCHLSFRELQCINFNWRDTPARPFWLEERMQPFCHKNLLYDSRLRIKKFVNFFDEFTKRVPKLQTLIIPFDLSLSRSIDSLVRLKKLQNLVLEKSSVFQCVPQAGLDKVLSGLPVLVQLILEVWTPSGPGLIKYELSSASLEFLDISQSRGFYLKALNMPKLKRFRVARHPWNGPLVCADRLNLPCLYYVLQVGTPNLQKINDHYLLPNWKEFCYPQLDEVFRAVCSCRKHKTGWMM